MLSSFWVSKPLGQPKVYHVHIVLFFADSYQEIIRLYVSMQKMATVNKLNSLQHLIGQHEHCFEAEFAFAVIQQIFE